MKELSLHLLDIAENSVAAGARHIEITVEEDLPLDWLKFTVSDDGKGMDEQLLARISDPFVTSRTTRKVGLGIPLLQAAAESCAGSLQISSTPGQGTRLTAEFQRSHIDRMPLGDLAGTMLTLLIGWPQIHWRFIYRVKTQPESNGAEFIFDDEPIKRELEGVSLTDPTILGFIKQLLSEGISRIQPASGR
ncbi:MAG: sensor histidine kinase [Anaerolineales bacterium]|nr:sensor histidine kinase [Anaerolineales bacterium]